MKRFNEAKRRLGELLDAEQRAKLVEGMLADVLAVLETSHAFEGVVCVTDEPRAIELAVARGAHVVPDPEEAEHSAAAAVGVEYVLARGADRAAMVAADCPLVSCSALDDAVASATTPSVTVVPDRHWIGTNALVLSPPDVIAPGFGPDSRARHIARADQEGVHAGVRDIPTLGLDIDTPEDFHILRLVLDLSTLGVADETSEALAEIGW